MSHALWAVRGLRTRAGDALTQEVINIRIAGDSGSYFTLARNIRWRHVFSLDQVPPFLSTYFRPPGYPVLIALLGLSIPALVILQAVLITFTSLLTYQIAKPFGRKLALISGILMSLAPMSAVYSGEVMTETLYTSLVALGVYFWSRSSLYWSGVLFGLSWLVRPSTLPFIMVLIAIGSLFKSQRPLLKIALAACLVCLPWTARNAVVFEKFVPVASGGAPQALLTGAMNIEYGKDFNAQIHDAPEMKLSQDEMGREAVRRIAGDPIGWLLNRAKQMPRFFIDLGAYLHPANPVLAQIVKFGFLAGNLLFVLLSAWGWWLNRSRLYLSIFPAAMLITHLPIFVEPRYSIPLVPVMIVLSVLAVTQLSAILTHPSLPPSCLPGPTQPTAADRTSVEA